MVLSNLFSNVPAVSSTFAGNLFLLGSIANLIVVEQAAQYQIRVSFLQHAVVGIPVTLASLAILLGWLALGQ